MDDSDLEKLTDAIARNCAAVLSLPSAGLLRNCKSRLLGQNADGLWVEVDATERALLEELIASQKQAGIAFRQGQLKVIFASSIKTLDLQYAMNATTTVPAILMAFPESLKSIQRRNNYRVRVLGDSGLTARVWRMPPRVRLVDAPVATAEIEAELRDLSLGGVGVVLRGEDGQMPKVIPEDRLRIQLTFNQNILLIEGRMRQPSGPQPAGTICTGLRFKEMDGDLEGRQKLNELTKILGELQREEVRRTRAV